MPKHSPVIITKFVDAAERPTGYAVICSEHDWLEEKAQTREEARQIKRAHARTAARRSIPTTFGSIQRYTIDGDQA